ncbi:MAG TPA: SDR family oxidoreductase [Candidatus Nanopelagicales bacterium]|nr:SDR family oxidoreductase [Candidatus Nanopelagicales bacterium]
MTTLVVTGGSRGIGAAVCVEAAAAGWDVVVDYARDTAAADSVVRRIRDVGGEALAVQADVSDAEQVEALFAAADAWRGPVTGLVNNAGIPGGQARVDEVAPEVVQRVLAVNVAGPFLCAAAAVRRMSSRHGGSGGSIVNITSRAAVLGSPGEFVHYAASKGALDTLTVGLALEVAAEGIRVNGVAVGLVDTDFHAAAGEPGRADRMRPSIPMQRSGTPEEVAAAVVWLLSDAASYTTGSTLAVTGGR